MRRLYIKPDQCCCQNFFEKILETKTETLALVAVFENFIILTIV